MRKKQQIQTPAALESRRFAEKPRKFGVGIGIALLLSVSLLLANLDFATAVVKPRPMRPRSKTASPFTLSFPFFIRPSFHLQTVS